MRYLKIASAKNPDTDFIELNDLNGFFCTQFTTLGISRKVDFLTIQNRNIPVDNKPVFKRYRLVIEILTLYSEYENKYYELMNFLDRNKKDGIRLYHKPYHTMAASVYMDSDTPDGRYCLCSILTTSKTEKRQPIVLDLTQNSLWIGKQQTAESTQKMNEEGNLFEFSNDGYDYYSASFSVDKNIPDYYCIAFYNGISTQAEIDIKCYNEVPITIVVSGECENPEILLFRKNENLPIKRFQVLEKIDKGHYLEINSGILESGVWEVNKTTGARRDLTELVNYALGSPYFYLGYGEYYVQVSDSGGNDCVTNVYWREEYSE